MALNVSFGGTRLERPADPDDLAVELLEEAISYLNRGSPKGALERIHDAAAEVERVHSLNPTL